MLGGLRCIEFRAAEIETRNWLGTYSALLHVLV
jgi:hypothetical protein